MRLATKCLKLSALVGLLGVSVWIVGCGEQSTPTPSVSPKSNGGNPAGSATGGGVDVPDMATDTGAAKPETDAPKDEPKTEEPKDEPKADEAKKEEPKADEAKKEEPTADEAKKEEPTADDK